MRFDRLVRDFLDEEEQFAWHKQPHKAGLVLFRKMIDDNEFDPLRCSPERGIDSATQSASSTPSPTTSGPRRGWLTASDEKHASDDDDAPRSEPLPWWIRILAHTQGLVTGSTTLGVLYFRRTHALYYVASSLATSFIAKGLKKVIKQPRPPGAAVKTTSGMPSTHSSAVTFMGLYLAVILLLSEEQPHSSSYSLADFSITSLKKWAPIVGLLTFPPLVMHSRVRLGMHTPGQCTAGAILGALCCGAFTALWRYGLAGTHFVAEIDGMLQAL